MFDDMQQNDCVDRDLLIQQLGSQYMAEVGSKPPEKSPTKSAGSAKLNEYSHDTGHF